MIREFPRNQTIYLLVNSSCNFPSCPWRSPMPSNISVSEASINPTLKLSHPFQLLASNILLPAFTLLSREKAASVTSS